MVASALKNGIVIAALAGVVGAAMPQDDLERYRTQLANMAPQAPTSPNDAAMAGTIAQWRALQQTDALPFDSYASFLLAHPGWPGAAATRRAAEGKAGTAAPASIIAFFRKYPPQSAAGGVAFARALQSIGATDESRIAVRNAWRKGALAPTDEAVVATYFQGVLTSDDQDARMDTLLWQGQTSIAARQIANTSLQRRGLYEARLAFRTNAPNAADLAASTLSLYGGDAGYIADRANWLRGNLRGAEARTYLAQPRTLSSRPGNVEKFYESLLTNARGAANDAQYQTAYDIARQVDDAYPAGTDVSVKPYGERDDYTSLVWLGGQVAMKNLGRPADAMTLFDRYGRGSQSPQTRAKGFYWAGRAAEAAGLRTEAAAYYERAIGYRDQFYGQLAAERNGRRLSAPPAIAEAERAAIDPGVRAAFNNREVVQAARWLGRIGDWQDQTAFVRQIASDATTDTDHLLAAQLSRDINRPDLGVMLGRSALQNGLSDYSAVGFPTVPVPAGYEGSWTLIHAIARQESQFDRAAVSHAGARGLMQLMPGTAREQSGKMGVTYDQAALTTDPNLSMQLGASYFQRIYDRFGSYPLAIAAYNAGGGNVNKWLAAYGDPRTGSIDMVDWIESIPFSETRNYVQRVLENAVVYDLMNPQRAKSGVSTTPLSWYLGKSGKPG